MKRLSFMHLLVWCILAYPAILFSQNNDCLENSMHCWKKTWIEPGILECPTPVTTFTEEFNNVNTINQNWEFDFGDGRDERTHTPCEEQLYNNGPLNAGNNFNNGNVRIDPQNGGRCVLTGKHEVPNVEYTWPGDANTPPVHISKEFSSGMLYCERPLHYGRVEARILDMPGDGWWPAFWLYDYEEIDVMERFSSGDTYYYNSYPGNQICAKGSEATTPPKALFGGPHMFAMEWTPFKTMYFYNGQQLPGVIYKYYHLDGTPLDVNCGDNIPGGFYYVNPNFVSPWRDEGGGTIATSFKPIINLAVVPRYGGYCCIDYSSGTGEIKLNNPLDQTCNYSLAPDFTDCTPAEPSQCSDLGNPFDINGNFKGGDFESTTEMKIDNFKLYRNTYRVSNSLALTYDNEICSGSELEIIIESIGNSPSLHWDDNVIDVQSITAGPHLTLKTASTPHKRYFDVEPNTSGLTFFTIVYKIGTTVHTITKEVNIRDCSDGLDPCADGSTNECCPTNTFYESQNCYYGQIPDGYTGYVANNTFYVNLNASGGCPPGYEREIVNVGGNNVPLCNSGIHIPQVHPGSNEDPDHYRGFIFENGFYVEPDCEDISDCCPVAYELNGGNCFSGVTFNSDWQPFIYQGSFYVAPHYDQNHNAVCPDPMTNPGDPSSPNGWTFDGSNCHSGVYFNAPFEGIIENGGFYVKPYCADAGDCCPPGTIANEAGGNCLFGYGPEGYGNGRVIGNLFCFEAPANCGPGQTTQCCPDGYSELIYESKKYCYNPDIEIPSNFSGFTYGELDANGNGRQSLYVIKNCPQERCCPDNANYVNPNESNPNIASKCWYGNIPPAWMDNTAPDGNRMVFYLVSQNECLAHDFQWDAQNNYCYIEVPESLSSSLEIIGESVYTHALPTCVIHLTGVPENRSEQEIELNQNKDSLSKATNAISIFPNPATNMLNIRFDADFSGPTVMKIFDLKGQLLQSTTINAPAKGSILTLFLNNILPGNYSLNFSSAGKNETHNFIKM